jgi:hypothetical protein
VLLWATGSSVLRADPPLLLIDSPFEIDGVFQPTGIYAVDLASGQLTLKADLGNAYTPCLGLAAASAAHLYAVCSDHDPVEVDGDDTCFNCVLVEIVLDPLSTVPSSITRLGRIQEGSTTIDQISGMTFRSDGALYAVSEPNGSEALYRIDLDDAGATTVGTLAVDCTSEVLDAQGGDLTFDDQDRLWLWTNHPTAPVTGKGLWEVDPGNACVTQASSCAGSPFLAGLSVVGHQSADTHLRGVSTTVPVQDRLYTFAPGSCPTTNVALTLDGAPFDMHRGDLDSPFCDTDASCEDGNPCTLDVCLPGGCRHDAQAADGLPCDDGDDTTCQDVCDLGVCLGTAVPVPPEVDDSVQLAKVAGGVEIGWTATLGVYNVYRGFRPSGTLWSYDQTCLQSGLLASPATDASDPSPRDLFYYLVSRVDVCRESVLGRNSAGIPDPNTSPCGGSSVP